MPEQVQLRASHLVVEASLAEKVFEQASSAYVSYKADRHLLLLCPSSNDWFPKLHEAREYILKHKDLKGTRSIAIRDMLLDHDLPSQDRNLAYELVEAQQLIKIYVS